MRGGESERGGSFAATALGAPWTRVHRLVLGGLAIAALVLGWQGRQRELLVLGDEPIYLTLSQSLAQGRYRDEFLAGTPRHVQYPPGMPALLLALRTAAGPDPDIARAANLLLLVVTLVLVADLARRLSTPTAGLTAGALVALNPVLLMRAGTLYAETLLMAAVAVGLWAAQRNTSEGQRGWVVVAVLAGIAGFLARVPGLALLAGLSAGWLVRRRWGAVAVAGLVTLGIAAWWFSYTTGAGGDSLARSYQGDLAPRVGNTIAAEAGRMIDHARIYLVRTLPTTLQVPTIPGTPVDNLLVVAFLAGLGLVGLVTVLRQAPATGFTLLVYGMLLLYWPWANARFLGPMLPWILVTLTVGAHRIGLRAGGQRGGSLLLGLLALTTVPAVSADLRAARAGRACERARENDSRACYPEPHRGYLAAAGFVRDSLPMSSLILAEHPATLYHLSRRRGFPSRDLARGREGEDLLRLRAHGMTHVLLGPARQQPGQRRLTGAVVKSCERFVPVAEFPGALLLAFADTARGHPNACASSARYLSALERTRDEDLNEPGR